MKTFILIYNPLSGDATFKNRLDSLIECMRIHSCFVIPFRTSRKEDTAGFLALAKQAKAEGIIVAGGDGTLHEVVNIMLNASLAIPVGIIPCGTCNDFATYLGIDDDIEKCCQLIAKGHTTAVDVGKANQVYFLNVASAGLFTSVAHNIEAQLKNTMGKMAYYLKGLGQLPNFNAYRMKILADDTVIDEDVLLFLVMNSGIIGSFPKLAPQARTDDGKLDLLIVNKCSLHELMALLVRIVSGNLTGQKHITYLQAAKINIECDVNVESDLDGELGPNLPLNISVRPAAVKIFTDGAN